MPENCENACSSLVRLEQQVDDLRRQNGADHKDFRLQIQEIEKEDAKQQERFDRIMDNLADSPEMWVEVNCTRTRRSRPSVPRQARPEQAGLSKVFPSPNRRHSSCSKKLLIFHLLSHK